MHIRVLGCSGSIAAGSRTTSFLLDESILIDAGTGVGDLTLDELTRIDHILISHSHLDHILSIGLLADSVTRRRIAARRPPVMVHALPATIAALKDHVFNGVIWPDFSRLPNEQTPVLGFAPIEVGQVLDLGGRRIEILPASHIVPAVGFAVPGSEGAWVFTGDTGPNAALWQRLGSMRVAALVIETAFSNDEAQLAAVSGHLCPSTLRAEISLLKQATDIYVTHIKPGEMQAVMNEVAAHGTAHRVMALQSGQRLVLRD